MGAGIVTVLLRQQRFYGGATDVIATRQQIRQIAALLPSDLRGISSVGGDIYTMSDSSIEFRSGRIDGASRLTFDPVGPHLVTGRRAPPTAYDKAQFRAKLGMKRAALSITHTSEQALAQVILES